MKPGESPEQSIARILIRETGTVITDLTRFHSISNFSLIWPTRAQEPKNAGTADLTVILTIQFTEQEVAAIKLDNNEYSEARWISKSDILSSNFHTAYKQGVKDLMCWELWSQIKHDASSQNIEDAKIIQKVKEIIAISKA